MFFQIQGAIELSVKPIRVCFVSPKAYPLFNRSVQKYFAGAELDLYLLSTELAKDADFDVSFVVADYGQEPVELWEDVRVIRSLDFRKGPLGSALRVWRALTLANADIYMAKTASVGVPLISHFCRRFGRSFVYRTASQRECNGSYIRDHLVLGRFFARSVRRADAVIVQSRSDAEEIASTIGVTSEVIANGHRIAELPTVERDTILWVGRSAPVKRPDLFLKLARTFPVEHFTMVCQRATGDGEFDGLCAEAATIDNLEFIPYVPFGRIDSYFARAKVFVNTSDSEGFPNTFIQACIAASPILSLRVNPDDFLVRNNCGLCAAGDGRCFIEMLSQLLDSPKAELYGGNGRRYAEQHHDISKIVLRYKSLFCALARQGD